jgi:WhiB family redox-sensing transcriptional regulator
MSDRQILAPSEFVMGGRSNLGNGGNQDLTWQERALCAQTDPEAFFPEKGEASLSFM